MKPGSLISIFVGATLSIGPTNGVPWTRRDIVTIEESNASSHSTGPIPKKFGVLAFPQYVDLDAYGPLSLFDIVAFYTPNMTLSIVAETMDPVPANILDPNSGSLTWVYPTYTFDQDPDFDVLLVPGGPESSSNNTKLIEYVKRTCPKLQYILSICTGARILAKAGVLDGKRATTSKFAWNRIVESGPNVDWVPCARWVVDGNIWTSSGVTAGMDLTYTFLAEVVGQGNSTLADAAANIIEYDVHKNATWDPFCAIWNVTNTSI